MLVTSGTVGFTDVVFVENRAALGGALAVDGTVTITRCTFLDNRADDSGSQGRGGTLYAAPGR